MAPGGGLGVWCLCVVAGALLGLRGQRRLRFWFARPVVVARGVYWRPWVGLCVYEMCGQGLG